MINRNSRICEIIELGDEVENILKKYGLLCAGCPGAMHGTLEEAAVGHGINLTELLEDLNEIVQG